ncbi:outer membrane beta-barrel protein [Flavobacterium gelidilacus]|uniref:outer membrane beta-barrel protein n=1 Tax=Flavobacterium gelidilacus TaxID=206041 RepID=UPI00054EF764|nr:outer membrane beta-barrel protein [Flavobacterium gelidilacus]
MHFKKITIALIFFITSMYSQNEMYLGLNSGLTYSKFRGNDYFKNMDSQLDFLIGTSFDIHLTERILLATNINYERNSVKKYYEYFGPGVIGGITGIPFGQSSASSSTPKNKFQTRFEYINIPITIKYLLNYEKKLYVNAGGYLGHLINVKNIDDGKESDLDFNNQFKKADYGLVLGIGYNYTFNPSNFLSIELRDNYGIKNINIDESYTFKNTKRNSLNLILNYHFKI